jgi:hypothetical protein
VSASPATSKAGDASAKAVTLQLKAKDCACPGPFRVVGRTTEGPRRSRVARGTIAGFDARTGHPWLTIRGEAAGGAKPK